MSGQGSQGVSLREQKYAHLSQNGCCGDDCSVPGYRLRKAGTYICSAIANGSACFARHQICLIAAYAIAHCHTYVYRNASADGNANCDARAHTHAQANGNCDVCADTDEHALVTAQRFREYRHRVRYRLRLCHRPGSD